MDRSRSRREMTFRPRTLPVPGLPLGARSIGHYRVPVGWEEGPVTKDIVQVIWGQQGEGVVQVERGEVTVGPGLAVVLLPGMVHHYRAVSAWDYRWFTVDGPLAGAIAGGLGLGPRLFPAGAPPVERLRQLRQVLADPLAEHRASALAYALLCELGAASGRPGDPLVDRALALIHRQWTDPAFGVARLAHRLDLHRSVLSRRIAAHQGQAPADYLAELRLEHARTLLAGTTLTIREVAQRSGYADPSYLARLLRRRTGKTPRAYRRAP